MVEEEGCGFGGVRVVRNLNNLFVELAGTLPWVGMGSWRIRPLQVLVVEDVLRHSTVAGL